MKERSVILVLIIAMLAVPVIYVAIYAADVQRGLYMKGQFQPADPFGGRFAELLFEPAYRVDLKLRPHYWRAERT